MARCRPQASWRTGQRGLLHHWAWVCLRLHPDLQHPSCDQLGSLRTREHDKDINGDRIIDGEATVAEVGAEIYNMTRVVASGQETKCESLDYGKEEAIPGILARSFERYGCGRRLRARPDRMRIRGQSSLPRLLRWPYIQAVRGPSAQQ